MPWHAGQGTVRPAHGKKKALAGGSHASARKGKGARKGPAEELDRGKKRREWAGAEMGRAREKGGNGKERGFGPENEPAEEKEKEKERGKELG